MSYQFIYTSTLLPGYTSPRGAMIARSHALPRLLADELVTLSSAQPRFDKNSTGKIFSYRTIVCGGSTFHVLTCQQPIPSSQAGAPAWTAHHIALTQDEVQALRRNASRPTPAGIIMALSHINLWRTQWNADTIYIEDEPTLTAAALPDPSLQPTWKKLTGHKSNARAFFSAPYDRECAVVMPDGSSTEDILMLCHESDWLSSSRGWGKTFKTNAVLKDAADGLSRLFTDRETAKQLATSENKIPTLFISERLVLDSSTDGESPAHSGNISTQNTANSTPSRVPYKFAETADEDTFNVLPPPNRMVRWLCCFAGVGLLWCSASVISGMFMEEAGELTGDIISRINAEEDIMLLAELASSPYSANTTENKLNKLESHLKTKPDTATPGKKEVLLQECVNLLRHARNDSGHPANLHRLRECSLQLNLDSNNICRLYMNEAINGRETDEWIFITPEEDGLMWQKLLKDCPELKDWLTKPPYSDYITPFLPPSEAPQSEQPSQVQSAPEQQPQPEQPTPEPPPASTSEPTENVPTTENPPATEPAPTTEPVVPEQQTSEQISALAPTLTVQGASLPAPLIDLLSKEKITVLTDGEFFISPIGSGNGASQPLKIELSNEGYSLAIVPESENTWKLQVCKEGTPDPIIPETLLRTDGKNLTELSYAGASAAVRLHTVDGKNRYNSHYLFSQLAINLTPVSAPPIPPVKDKKLFTLTPEKLNCSKSRSVKNPAKITLKKNINFTSLSGTVVVKLNRHSQLTLPVLGGQNDLHIDNPSLPNYKLSTSKAQSNQPGINKWNWKLERTYEFDSVIKKYIDIAANSYCCGEHEGNDFYSLATLYSIADENIKNDNRNEMAERYFNLFKDKKFGDKLRLNILMNDPEFVVSEEDIKGSLNDKRKAKEAIEKMLRKPSKRNIIRKKICEILSNTAVHYYEQEYEKQMMEGQTPLLLQLTKVEVDAENNLKWYFSLTPQQAN